LLFVVEFSTETPPTADRGAEGGIMSKKKTERVSM